MTNQQLNLKLFLAGVFILLLGVANAQTPTYSASLENDQMVSSSVYEFDLILNRTGSNPLELANFQAAISIDPAFVNGGIITPSIVTGSSELNAVQWPTSIAFSQSQSCIMIAPRVPPRTLVPGNQTSYTNGTFISPLGTRVCRIRLENSANFGSGAINPIWNFTFNPYRTAITAFIGPDDYKVNTFITMEESFSKTLNLEVLVEGFYEASDGMMRKTQDVDDDYNTFDNFTGLTVDTITVQLAQATSPWNIVHTVHAVNLNTDGRCRISVPGNLSGNYYVVFKHRNSLETWSKSGGESFSGTSTTFDLTSNVAQAFGGNLKQIDIGKYALFSGDIESISLPGTQDGYIELPDVNAVYNLNLLGAYGYQKADLTGDGFVELPDVNMVYNNSLSGVGLNTPPNPAGKKK